MFRKILTRLSIAVTVLVSFSSIATAQNFAPNVGNAQTFNSELTTLQSQLAQSNISQTVEDLNNDYEVYTAVPVSGIEWVVDVIFAGEEKWELLGHPQFNPVTETVYYSGVRTFESQADALETAELLIEMQIIDEFDIFFRVKQPQWQFFGRYTKRRDAEAVATSLGKLTDRITEIRRVSVGR